MKCVAVILNGVADVTTMTKKTIAVKMNAAAIMIVTMIAAEKTVIVMIGAIGAAAAVAAAGK